MMRRRGTGPWRHEESGNVLANSTGGNTCKVVSISGGTAMRRRLMDLNVLPGQDIHVIQNDGWGPVLAGVEGTRIVLGRSMAEHVIVRCGEVCAGSSPGGRYRQQYRRKHHGDHKRFTR